MKLLSLTINGTDIQGGGNVPTGGEVTMERILQLGISYLYIAAVVLALIYLIWGGLSWITSEGDKQRLSQARQRIVMALVGLIIVFFAFFVINFVGNFFGLDILSGLLAVGGGGGARRP